MMKNPVSIAFLFLMMFLQLTSQAQIFHEDFENPDSVFYYSNSSASWGQNSRLYTSGSFCDSASIQNGGDTIIMTTLPFSTLGMNSVFLSFNHICKVEFFDDAIVEASPDNGLTWHVLNSDMYLGQSLYSFQADQFGETSYVNWNPGQVISPDSSWWKTENFDLSILLTNQSQAMIRFVLIDHAVPGGYGRAGWFIDDLVIDSSFVNINSSLYNRIGGKIYYDENSNLIQDGNEQFVFQNQVNLTSALINKTGYTLQNGKYFFNFLDTGIYNVEPMLNPIASNYFVVTPPVQTVSFTTNLNYDTTGNFGIQPLGVYNDLAVNICPGTAFRPGQIALYYIDYINQGTTVQNAEITLYLQSNCLTYTYSSVLPDFISTDSLTWNIDSIAPFSSGFITVAVFVATTKQLGTIINSSVKIEPIAGDATPTDNIHAWEVPLMTSYDPNDILVNKDTFLIQDLINQPDLDYIIRFQNTGNDTAFYVRINNNIPTELDMNSFHILGSSHNVTIEHGPTNNQMKFIFYGIMLPDSNTNEPASHGFIHYRIKPNSNLAVGDSILNNAAIYFDFNPPVITNTAVTEIIDPTSIGEISMHNNWSVYPNPVNSELNMKYEIQNEENVSIEIYNFFGQKMKVLVDEKVETGMHHNKFNIESLSNGVYVIQFVVGGTQQVKKFVKVD